MEVKWGKKTLWKKEGIIFSLIDIENQTMPDKNMVLRVLNYDGASYGNQMSLINSKLRRARKKLREEELEIYPVITIAVYYGEAEWKEARSLKERLKTTDFIKNFISDYTINLIEIKN